MNDYPPLEIQQDGYAPEIASGVNLSRGSDGTPWLQVLYSAEQTTFQLVHPALDAEEVALLKQFYRDNHRLRVRYTEPDTGDQYSVFMLHPPLSVARVGGGLITYRMTLTGQQLV